MNSSRHPPKGGRHPSLQKREGNIEDDSLQF